MPSRTYVLNSFMIHGALPIMQVYAVVSAQIRYLSIGMASSHSTSQLN